MVQGLVFNLTLPCAIVMSFATNKHPMNLLWLVVFGLFACMIPLFIVYFGSRGDEPRYRAYQMLNASGLTIHPFDCYMLMLVFMFAGWTVPQWIVTLITPFANANAFAAMAMIGLMMEIPDNHKDRSELGKVIAWRFLFSIIIALSAWFLLPLDERVREIVVLAAFAPVTIFSTKFTDSLTGNAKLAGFSLTVTAIIGLTFMTILHAALPVA